MKNKFFKKIPQSFITAFSLAGVAAINYTILHNPLVLLILLVLLAHELGHYFAAKINNAKPYLPVFLPLPFLVIGITRVKNLTTKGKRDVALFGPLVGSLTALLLIILNGILKFTSTIPLVLLLFGEIVFNYFGSDGLRYRKFNRSLQCIS